MPKDDNKHTLLLAVAAIAATAGALAVPLSSLMRRAYIQHRHKRHTRFTLGSWRAREYGQAVRYLLAYLELPWQDRYFELGPAPDYNQLAWVDAKGEAARDKAEVPFSEQGLTTYLVMEERGWLKPKEGGKEGGGWGKKRRGVKHARTIMRCLGRQHGLIGRNVKEMEAVDLLLDELQDFNLAIHALVHSPSFLREKERFLTSVLPTRLRGFENWLLNEKRVHKKSAPTGGLWLVGGRLTVADFVMYDLLCQARTLCPSALTTLRELQDFTYRFESLPAIAAFLGSEACQLLPLYTSRAAFNP